MNKVPDNAKYVKVWWSPLKHYGLSPTELLLAFLIDRLCQNKFMACSASKEYLADTLNVSVWTIYNALDQLEQKEIIIRMRGTYSRSKGTMTIKMTQEWDNYIKRLQFWWMSDNGNNP